MFRRFQHVHFVGIGGIGMSGIAEVLANLGFRVSGSDQKKSEVTAHLEDLGVDVTEGHTAENVGDAHVVVRSTAVRDEFGLIDALLGTGSSGKPAGAGDIKRGQAGIAHLRRDHVLETHAPFAGRIAWRSSDRRLAVGDAG